MPPELSEETSVVGADITTRATITATKIAESQVVQQLVMKLQGDWNSGLLLLLLMVIAMTLKR